MRIKRKYEASSKIYVLYRDEFPIAVGTIRELAEKTGLKENTLFWYASPANIERVEERGKGQYLVDSGKTTEDW